MFNLWIYNLWRLSLKDLFLIEIELLLLHPSIIFSIGIPLLDFKIFEFQFWSKLLSTINFGWVEQNVRFPNPTTNVNTEPTVSYLLIIVCTVERMHDSAQWRTTTESSVKVPNLMFVVFGIVKSFRVPVTQLGGYGIIWR